MEEVEAGRAIRRLLYNPGHDDGGLVQEGYSRVRGWLILMV